MDWSHITGWKLLAGPHGFPGPEGGSCLNEVAAVVAGFPYRRVSNVSDLPECFCPVLGGVGILLNDMIKNDEVRTKLLFPFVTRLSGSRDADEVMVDRAQRIVRGFSESIMQFQVPMVAPLARSGPRDWETGYNHYSSRAPTCRANFSLLNMINANFRDEVQCRPIIATLHAAERLLSYAMEFLGDHKRQNGIDSIAMPLVAVLKAAFDIGKQAEPLEPALAEARMEKIKAEARERPRGMAMAAAVEHHDAMQFDGGGTYAKFPPYQPIISKDYFWIAHGEGGLKHLTYPKMEPVKAPSLAMLLADPVT